MGQGSPDSEILLEVANLPALQQKIIQELHEIAASIVYDGEVDDREIEVLSGWLRRHSELSGIYPLSKLFVLLHQIEEDGKVDKQERLQLLLFLSGISVFARTSGEASEAIFDLNPEITFKDRCFLFLGKMEIADVSRAEQAVGRLGGTVVRAPGPEVSYLVLGDLDAASWRASPHAGIIRQVQSLKEQGAPTLIVSEPDFIQAAVRA